MCSFCDQKTISGTQKPPSGNDVRRICEKALSEVSEPENSEIAFFGGSFTAVPRDYMEELLTAASEYVGDGKFKGIRISTRPDYIDGDILDLIKNYGVTSVEIGAQSMNDEVLVSNGRGHSSADVVSAAKHIRGAGLELGIQMMTGLYKSTPETDMETAEKIVGLNPDTVRIYPVVVLKGTVLADLCETGKYKPVSFRDMVELCGKIMLLFEKNGIKVIKCGLHASETVRRDMIAGYYHPAFRELCESEIYRGLIKDMIEKTPAKTGSEICVEVNDKCLSRAIGQKRSNINYFRSLGYNVSIKGNAKLPCRECRVMVTGR